MTRNACLAAILHGMLMLAVLTGGVHYGTAFLLCTLGIGAGIWAASSKRFGLAQSSLHLPLDKKQEGQLFLGFGPLGWMLLLMMLATAVTLIPLPLGVLELLSPASAAIYREAGALSRAPQTWGFLSVSSARTAFALWHLLGFFGVYLAASQIFWHRRSIRKAYRLAWIPAGVLALLIVLRLAFNYDLDFGHTAYGPWVKLGLPTNENHVSALLLIFSMMALGSFTGQRRSASGAQVKRALWLLLYVFFSILLIMLHSRGAIWAWAMGHLFILMGYWVRRERGKTLTTIAIASAFVIVLLTAFYFSADKIAELKTEFHVTQGVASEGGAHESKAGVSTTIEKTQLWSDFWTISQDWQGRGYGRSAFFDIYPAYQSFAFEKRFRHLENEVLEILLEYGFFWGALVLFLGLWAVIRLLRQRSVYYEDRCVGLGMLAGVVAVFLQNLFDFSLRYWTASLLVFVILGLLCGRSAYLRQVKDEDSLSRLRRGKFRKYEFYLGSSLFVLALVVAIVNLPKAFDGITQVKLSTLRQAAIEATRDLGDSELTREAMNLYPASSELRLYVGMAYINVAQTLEDSASKQKQIALALPWLASAHRRAPRDADIALTLGKSLEVLGNEQSAVQSYILSAKNDRYKRALGMREAARLRFEHFDGIEVEAPEIALALVRELIVLKRYPEALELIQRLVVVGYPQSNLDLLKCRIYKALDFAEACEVLVEALPDEIKNMAQFELKLSWLIQEKNYPEAFSMIDLAEPYLNHEVEYWRLRLIYSCFYGKNMGKDWYQDKLPPLFLRFKRVVLAHPSLAFDEALCEAEYARQNGHDRRAYYAAKRALKIKVNDKRALAILKSVSPK